MLIKALGIAIRAHHGQKDRAGKPYILHPITVALKMDTKDEFITALLHDVMEDSNYTAEDLREAGIPEHIIEALLLLTHDKNEDYLKYVAKIKKNELAKAVKLGDLQHNSDLSRLPAITDADIVRANKYHNAMTILRA